MAIDSRRWFHNELSGIAAEKLLIAKGEPGSFLIRQSRNSPGNFTLSVRRKDSFAHIRIQNTGDFLSFFGGDKFATLPELVNYYREHPDQLKEENGTVIELRYPLMVEDTPTESARWFHGRQTATEAQELLLGKGKDGSFLVRESIRQPGSYVLSVVTGGSKVSHILVNRLPNSKYDLGDGQEFSSLNQLIEHYTAYPLMVMDGNLICLKQPFNVTRLNVSRLDARIAQLEKEGVRRKRVTGFWEEFEELHQDDMAPRTEGDRPANRAKNRFKNILPFDATRVVLHDTDPATAQPGADYINANFISVPAFLREGLQPPCDLNLSELETTDGENRRNPKNNGEEEKGVKDDVVEKKARDQEKGIGNTGEGKMKECKEVQQEEEEEKEKRSVSRDRQRRLFFSSRPQYIATQGVLPGTIVDFWRMVWQERAAIIVMLTRETERGRNKCEKYWPTEIEGPLVLPVPRGNIKITPVSERDLDSHVIRELKVSLHRAADKDGKDAASENDSFTVFQIQFLAWPEQGTPSDPSDFLDLLFNVSSYRGSMESPGPLVVHCSSGLGRTGTLIVVDMLLSCIREGGLHTDIDIARTVQAVREQRSGMVQTEAQYRFIYKVVQEFVSNLLLRVKLRNALKPFGVEYTNLKQTPKSEGCLCCTGLASSVPGASPTSGGSGSSILSSSLPNSSRGFWTNAKSGSSSAVAGRRPAPPPLPPLHQQQKGEASLALDLLPASSTAASTASTVSRKWYKLSSASR